MKFTYIIVLLFFCSLHIFAQSEDVAGLSINIKAEMIKFEGAQFVSISKNIDIKIIPLIIGLLWVV